MITTLYTRGTRIADASAELNQAHVFLSNNMESLAPLCSQDYFKAFFLSKEYYNYYEAFSQSKQEPKRLQRHLHLNTFGFLTNTMHIKTMMKTPPPNTPTVAAML